MHSEVILGHHHKKDWELAYVRTTSDNTSHRHCFEHKDPEYTEPDPQSQSQSQVHKPSPSRSHGMRPSRIRVMLANKSASSSLEHTASFISSRPMNLSPRTPSTSSPNPNNLTEARRHRHPGPIRWTKAHLVTEMPSNLKCLRACNSTSENVRILYDVASTRQGIEHVTTSW